MATLGTMAFPAWTFARPTATGATIGTFTFSGQLKGRLKVPARWNVSRGLSQVGCQITSEPTSWNIFFYNVRLAFNGHQKQLNGGFPGAAIDLNFAVTKRGDTESLAYPSATATVGFTAYIGHTRYSWETNARNSASPSSGTITTNALGTAGSVNATLAPTGTGFPGGVSGAATAPVTIAGTWSHCKAHNH